ncbi:hypothetical protein BY996DRAFT_6513517 [Phakopsora pachyrhizi]|nr:hypothetical protein BY996DRAFT_6513517 [Phakopsora pachyrhizi]
MNKGMKIPRAEGTGKKVVDQLKFGQGIKASTSSVEMWWWQAVPNVKGHNSGSEETLLSKAGTGILLMAEKLERGANCGHPGKSYNKLGGALIRDRRPGRPLSKAGSTVQKEEEKSLAFKPINKAPESLREGRAHQLPVLGTVNESPYLGRSQRANKPER